VTNSVHIAEDIAEPFLADWSSSVGQAVEETTEALLKAAKGFAPVSKRGSKYAPPGTLRDQVHSVQTHGTDGHVLGLVGVSRSKTRGYPLNFIASASGRRAVANRWGRYGDTSASNYFLQKALGGVNLFSSPGGMFS
jgi:hypothetical protein